MSELARSKYFNDFFLKAQQKNDEEVFEAFIYHWLAMIIGMTDLLSNHGGSNRPFKGDRDLIHEFKRRCIADFEEIQTGFQKLEIQRYKSNLAQRKGTRLADPIVDHSGDSGDFLAQLWKNQNHSANELDYFLDVACVIRNNVFHGKKSFLNPEDEELIKNTVHLIENINGTIATMLH